ncbi:phosphonate ABC transporter, permease protein PhnE [Alteribacter lacisalsi]|uniref:Phosphonate ABC transporter, permease protein PhnE n=1 Tax=Alteribacter lacisalsi TaxID=2045244 RepID=A0A2W0HGL5_9BACI|nr:phosphonate ABC transporter, permease protein PhnE [Alteribacter lacisalsi]PYZ99050.1 phosphonate ABC transporter, permease protein PhnE [Alteribacter lacisalsi]
METEKNLKKGKGRIPITPTGLKWYLSSSIVLVIALYVLSAYLTDAFPNRVIEGFPIIFSFVVDDLFPPNWGYVRTVSLALLETWNIALLSTTLAAIIAIPFCVLGASNINTNNFFYQFIRIFLNLLRTIPEIILAVLFVAVVGLGALSGVLALTIFSLGIFAKLMSETIETIDPGPLEAIRASGGNVLQVIAYGVVPQVAQHYASYALYILEINVKASVVLGFVGAGGIGLILRQQLNMFNYANVSTIIILTFVTITIIDYVSNKVREGLN